MQPADALGEKKKQIEQSAFAAAVDVIGKKNETWKNRAKLGTKKKTLGPIGQIGGS